MVWNLNGLWGVAGGAGRSKKDMYIYIHYIYTLYIYISHVLFWQAFMCLPSTSFIDAFVWFQHANHCYTPQIEYWLDYNFNITIFVSSWQMKYVCSIASIAGSQWALLAFYYIRVFIGSQARTLEHSTLHTSWWLGWNAQPASGVRALILHVWWFLLWWFPFENYSKISQIEYSGREPSLVLGLWRWLQSEHGRYDLQFLSEFGRYDIPKQSSKFDSLKKTCFFWFFPRSQQQFFFKFKTLGFSSPVYFAMAAARAKPKLVVMAGFASQPPRSRRSPNGAMMQSALNGAVTVIFQNLWPFWTVCKGYLGWKEVVYEATPPTRPGIGKIDVGDLVAFQWYRPFKLLRVSQRSSEDHVDHFGMRSFVAAAIRHLVQDWEC